MSTPFHEARQWLLSGYTDKALQVLMADMPDDETIQQLHIRFHSNENDFMSGLLEPDKYKTTKTQIGEALRRFLSGQTPKQPGKSSSVFSIYYFCSSPDQLSPVRFGEELKAIDEAMIRAGEKARSFSFKPLFAVSQHDLVRTISAEHPDGIVISMHGSGASQILFTAENGQKSPLDTDGLEKDFSLFTSHPDNKLKFVLFSACHSALPAQIISRYVPYCIGYNDVVTDMAACAFADGFFTSFFNDKLIEYAVGAGRSYIRKKKSVSAEENKVQLFKNGNLVTV